MIGKLPDILIGIVMILVLSASMSTLSSLVLTSSSTLVLDFINGTVVKSLSEKKKLFLIRLFILVFIAISVVIAIVQYKQNLTFIAQFMGISWGAMAGSFLAPMVYSLYSKRITKAAVMVNFLFASVLMTTNMLARSLFPAILRSPINCGAFAMLAGLILVPLVSVFTGRPDAALTDAAFSCYSEKVVVDAKEALTEPAGADKA